LILLFAASLLISLALGVGLTFLLWPSVRGGAAAWALRLLAGGGLGLGLASCLYFMALAAGLARFIPLIDLAACLLLGIFAFVLYRRGAAGPELELPELKDPQISPPPERQKRSPWLILLAGIFSVELAASVVSFAMAFFREPHGRWDSWLIWNMHARFLYRGGDHWRDAFASGLDWSHWDYPLLLPLSIVRSWSYMGGEHSLIPALIAFVFTFLTLGLLTAALAFLKGASPGLLAAMVLMGTPFFIAMGASQFADMPLAFFILATFVLLCMQARSPENPPGLLILAGFAAGLCAWTKNEGLLFLPVAAASLFLTALYAAGFKEALGRTVRFLAGALPILLVVIYFKTQLAPTNDLMAGFGAAGAIADKLTDWSRYAQIAKAFFITGISFTQGLIDVRVGLRLNPGAVSILLLIAYLLLAGVRIEQRDRPGIIQSAAILGLMLTGFFFVYALTPLDLGYHLATSLNRIFLQLWPAVIFLIFMAAGTQPLPPQKPSPPAKGLKRQKAPEAK
jgi:hypothetical protein